MDEQFSADASAAIQRAIETGKFNVTRSGTDAIRKAVRDALSSAIPTRSSCATVRSSRATAW